MATRTDTTLWRLLVWAYRSQLVRRCGQDIQIGSSRSATELALQSIELGIVSTARSFGTVALPEDALTVASVVGRLAKADYRVIVAAAESDAPPDWNPHLPPCQCRPRRRDNGKIQMMYRRPSKSSEPYASLVEVLFDDTWAERKRAEARAQYDAFHTALVRLYPVLASDGALLRWRVAGVGLPARPWQKDLDRWEKT